MRGAGRHRTGAGYIEIADPTKGRDYKGRMRYIMEHVAIAERALGKKLPPQADVHHINGIKSDNRPENLVICQDAAYHKMLHRRQRALDGCGHVDWRQCWHCKGWSDPLATDFYVSPNLTIATHRSCALAHQRQHRGTLASTFKGLRGPNKRSAAARFRAEQCEAAVQRWLQEQES